MEESRNSDPKSSPMASSQPIRRHFWPHHLRNSSIPYLHLILYSLHSVLAYLFSLSSPRRLRVTTRCVMARGHIAAERRAAERGRRRTTSSGEVCDGTRRRAAAGQAAGRGRGQRRTTSSDEMCDGVSCRVAGGEREREIE
ncbi:hypothetical protein U1Q18_046187 [Sarracenia purpurea var. burkii]